MISFFRFIFYIVLVHVFILNFFAPAHAADNAVSAINENRALLEYIANPTDLHISTTCGLNKDCREGLASDAKALRAALKMFDSVVVNKKDSNKKIGTFFKSR